MHGTEPNEASRQSHHASIQDAIWRLRKTVLNAKGLLSQVIGEAKLSGPEGMKAQASEPVMSLADFLAKTPDEINSINDQLSDTIDQLKTVLF